MTEYNVMSLVLSLYALIFNKQIKDSTTEEEYDSAVTAGANLVDLAGCYGYGFNRKTSMVNRLTRFLVLERNRAAYIQ